MMDTVTAALARLRSVVEEVFHCTTCGGELEPAAFNGSWEHKDGDLDHPAKGGHQ